MIDYKFGGRKTLEEAFEEVLRLSPQEIIDTPIDPFIKEAFDFFEISEDIILNSAAGNENTCNSRF